QARAARFANERILPIIAECFEAGRFPSELVPEMGRLGLFGSTFKEYGCAGLSNVAYGLIMQELERGDGGIRSFASVQSSLVMYPIHRYGSEEQKQRWLPSLARGEQIGCYGLTEPHGGSDPGAMKTHAERDGNYWVINGTKRWATSATIADVAVIWAMTADGVRGFLVEKSTPGFQPREIHHKFSLRASVSSEVLLNDARVPEANRLPGAMGLAAPLSCLTQARYGIAWGVIGAAQACYQEALSFARERVLFGQPLTHKQLIQTRLADMLRRITTAQLLAFRLAQLKDEGRLHHAQVSLAKWNNVRMALDVAREARDLLGANGITLEHCAIRHMLNLESVITYEGTETVHQLAVGREIADGTPAF
ncbi:MAG TPA: acyl-CoA dehydrogenase family protein, partial [Phycisphaerae bacterium]|nr:acyl-CoA dehydrogenase family protein [Phycisphaerae bacterium]